MAKKEISMVDLRIKANRGVLQKIAWKIRARIRLRRICKCINIKPTKMQLRFVINEDFVVLKGRRTGKTTATILLALLLDPKDVADLYTVLRIDVESQRSLAVAQWQFREYYRLYKLCEEKGLTSHCVSLMQYMNHASNAERGRLHRCSQLEEVLNV